jgi:spoIIIJ-associated protein
MSVDESTPAEPRDADAAQEAAGDNGDEQASTGQAGADLALLEREGDIAADYLETLLDIADLDGDIDIDVEGNRAAVSIVGADLSSLVGRDGATLEALQELTRLAGLREPGVRSRLMLDISGYRAGKRAELEELAQQTAQRVIDSGEPVRLRPMTPFERKVVHDAVARIDGVVSESEGNEPERRVVVSRG